MPATWASQKHKAKRADTSSSSNTTVPPNNGAILNIAHIIKNVMSSATKAELAGLYIMACKAVYIRTILEELGHVQSPTPLQTDNAMADWVINGKVQPKQTKAMDMRLNWLCNQECQWQSRIYWRPGKLNYANYWTKHHPETHHCNKRKKISLRILFSKCYEWNNKVMQLTQHERVTTTMALDEGVMILASSYARPLK